MCRATDSPTLFGAAPLTRQGTPVSGPDLALENELNSLLGPDITLSPLRATSDDAARGSPDLFAMYTAFTADSASPAHQRTLIPAYASSARAPVPDGQDLDLGNAELPGPGSSLPGADDTEWFAELGLCQKTCERDWAQPTDESQDQERPFSFDAPVQLPVIMTAMMGNTSDSAADLQLAVTRQPSHTVTDLDGERINVVQSQKLLTFDVALRSDNRSGMRQGSQKVSLQVRSYPTPSHILLLRPSLSTAPALDVPVTCLQPSVKPLAVQAVELFYEDGSAIEGEWLAGTIPVNVTIGGVATFKCKLDAKILSSKLGGRNFKIRVNCVDRPSVHACPSRPPLASPPSALATAPNPLRWHQAPLSCACRFPHPPCLPPPPSNLPFHSSSCLSTHHSSTSSRRPSRPSPS